MINILEVIKANKGVIIKRGLIALGSVAGLTIVTKVLGARITDIDDLVEIDENTEEDDDDDSEEE